MTLKMNITGLIGSKIDQKQVFLEDGTRIPVSLISLNNPVITQVKHMEKDGYTAIQIGSGSTTKAKKSAQGIAKKAGLDKTPRFFREIRVDDVEGATAGSAIVAEDVFAIGDIVNVTGTSKGKGYAGVVKRHGFKGGPKTHGQSDRHRAPGSIGQSTTPGRVYKGKRIAGRMGDEQVTIRNLVIMDIQENIIVIKGLIPGVRGGLVEIAKIGAVKKFVPLFKVADEIVEVPAEEVATPEEVVEAPVVETESAAPEATDTPEEKKEEPKE
jgi:large subunit ribosomal protein L3